LCNVWYFPRWIVTTCISNHTQIFAVVSEPEKVINSYLTVIGVAIGCNSGKTTGNRNRDIADRLFISEETVKAHMKHILEKLGASDRTQAVTIAARSEASFRPLFST
jgi:hypothetical protein